MRRDSETDERSCCYCHWGMSSVSKGNVQSTLPQVQEWVKTKVAETLWKWEQIRELIKLWIPENYLKAIQELWVEEAKIANRYKNWKTDPEYKALVESGAQKYWMTLEEAHAVYGYTIWIFDIPLNNLLRSWWWRNTEMYRLIPSGLNKMPKVDAPVQYRWDKHNFFNVKAWDIKTLDWFVSTSSEKTEWFWDKAIFQVTIHDTTSTRDISDLSFFKNFAWKINKTPTSQESLMLPDAKIVIERVKPTWMFTEKAEEIIEITARQIPDK